MMQIVGDGSCGSRRHVSSGRFTSPNLEPLRPLLAKLVNLGNELTPIARDLRGCFGVTYGR